MNVIPTEVAGWLMRRARLHSGAWVLVMSRLGLLASSLLVRGPVGINVAWAVPELRTVEQLTTEAGNVRGQLRSLDALPPISWNQWHAYNRPARLDWSSSTCMGGAFFCFLGWDTTDSGIQNTLPQTA
jgi:hypothetical protein